MDKWYLCLLLLCLQACKEHKKENTEFKKLDIVKDSALTKRLEWYLQESNYTNNENYRKKFIKDYKDFITTKDYESTKLLLFNTGTLFLDMYLSDSVIGNHTLEFLNLNLPLKEDTFYVSLYYLYAVNLFNSDKMREAITWGEKALIKNKTLQSKYIEIKVKNLIGSAFNQVNEPKKAIQYFSEIIPIAEQEKDYKLLGSVNYNMAYAYEILYAYHEAKDKYKNAASNFMKAKDTTRYFSLQCSFATNNFFVLFDTLSTLKFIDSIEKQFQDFKNPSELSISNINGLKSLKYYLTNEYDSALLYNNKSGDYFRKTNNNIFLIYYEYFGEEIYFKKNKKINNKQKIFKIIDHFEANGNNLELQQLFHLLYENAKIESNSKEALFYKEKEDVLANSGLINNQKGQLFEFDKKYQTEKKEQEILKQRIALKDKSNTITLLIIAFCIIALTLIANKYRQNRNKTKKEKQQTDNYTKQLFEKTEEERERIATDLHDSISHELMSLKNFNTIDSVRVNNKIDIIINDIRTISRNLHPVLFDKVGLQNTLEQLVQRIQIQKGFMLTSEISYRKGLSVTTELQLYRIIQEAVTNMVKYSNAVAGKINIKETNNHVKVEIKDNGQGFDVIETLNSQNSFGLHNIIQRSRAIGNAAEIKSDLTGTTISFSIPKILS